MGALQVSEYGDLANWMIPERGIGNVGGAMDLAVGAKKVIVCMEHIDRSGSPKIVQTCSYPLTANTCVDLIVTDLAVISVDKDGLLLMETCPGWSIEEIMSLTDAELRVSPHISDIEL